MQHVKNVQAAYEILRERYQRNEFDCVNDLRNYRAGCVLVLCPGIRYDPRSHVTFAQYQDALALIVEARNFDEKWFAECHDKVILVDDLFTQLSALGNDCYAKPSEHLRVFAITGTNGKTSISFWIAQAFTALGYRCGVIGTLGADYFDQLPKISDCSLTTPNAIRIQSRLAKFVNDGAQYCAMEASSIGLHQGRMAEVRVRTAIWTQLTHDHLDYHKSMEAYAQAKMMLFDAMGLANVVIGSDDVTGRVLFDKLTLRKDLCIWTYGFETFPASSHHVLIRSVVFQTQSMQVGFSLNGMNITIELQVIGKFNALNAMAVIAALLAEGFSMADVITAIETIRAVPGRMQIVGGARHKALVVVDYAHTPDALEKALLALKPLSAKRDGKLWCVFGCGGNRDSSKRLLMGKLAERLADYVIITSDNPRAENPLEIIEAIKHGTSAVDTIEVEVDRQRAIAFAIAHAHASDIVLIAGKGHESYQEINGVRYAFDDALVAKACLNQREEALCT